MRTSTCVPCLSSLSSSFERGEAGASAARTYERRADRHRRNEQAKVEADRAWREAAKENRPVLGRLASALTPKARIEPEPSHVRSWGQGAPGERRVGQVIDAIERVVGLHDRKVPGSRANIDHIAVGPAGVYVIDAKRYVEKAVERRDVGGWFRVDERLYVGGRDRTALVNGMAWQVAAVTAAAGSSFVDTVVQPVLCFVESTWGWLPKPFQVRGVSICWPLALEGLLSRPGPLDAGAREDLARHLGGQLPPA